LGKLLKEYLRFIWALAGGHAPCQVFAVQFIQPQGFDELGHPIKPAKAPA